MFSRRLQLGKYMAVPFLLGAALPEINNMMDYTEIMEGTLTPAKEDYMITSVSPARQIHGCTISAGRCAAGSSSPPGFFFFSVHESSLYDIPAVACIVILALFMLNKKWVMYVVEALYTLALLYHALVFRTISYNISFRDAFRLVLGAVVTFGAC